MFCKYCGPDVPSIQMFSSDVCDNCATIQGLKDEHPEDEIQKIIDHARKKVQEKTNGNA